jgi:hypothetical protein
MIGICLSGIEIQALCILKTFAIHILPAQIVGIPKKICDFVAIVPGGAIVCIKLKPSITLPLSRHAACEILKPEYQKLKSLRDRGPVRLELWVSIAEGSWQFFEINTEGVREVEHACQP